MILYKCYVHLHVMSLLQTCHFHRNQGGLLWCIVPEALLDYQDFHHWVHSQDVETLKGSIFNPQSQEEFDDLSKQAWTHLLMQIIKVCTTLPLCAHLTLFIIFRHWCYPV